MCTTWTAAIKVISHTVKRNLFKSCVRTVTVLRLPDGCHTMCVFRSCWQWAICAHFLFLWWREENKTLDWQTDKFHAILYCGACGFSRNADCYLLSCWFSSHWVGFPPWNSEISSVGRTLCEKCYTNTHPQKRVQLKNYTVGNFYTNGTHRDVFGNSESIWQKKRQKSLLLSSILFSLK